MSDAPKRPVELICTIGADSREELARALEQLAFEVVATGTTGSTCGGPSYGWIVSVTDNPDMTHDKYFEELDAYLKQKYPRETHA